MVPCLRSPSLHLSPHGLLPHGTFYFSPMGCLFSSSLSSPQQQSPMPIVPWPRASSRLTARARHSREARDPRAIPSGVPPSSRLSPAPSPPQHQLSFRGLRARRALRAPAEHSPHRSPFPAAPRWTCTIAVLADSISAASSSMWPRARAQDPCSEEGGL
jgi:hypothetical protein